MSSAEPDPRDERLQTMEEADEAQPGITLSSSAPGMPPPEVPDPPATGDPDVDEALARLHASASSGDLDAQVDAGEAVHRALQGRLADLGGA